METQVLKKAIHDLVEEINDKELLELYLRLLRREAKREAPDDFFSASDTDLYRAKKSIESIEAGRTRSLKEFTKDIEEWKKKKSTW